MNLHFLLTKTAAVRWDAGMLIFGVLKRTCITVRTWLTLLLLQMAPRWAPNNLSITVRRGFTLLRWLTSAASNGHMLGPKIYSYNRHSAYNFCNCPCGLHLEHQSGQPDILVNWWDTQEASSLTEEEIPKDILHARSFSTECIKWSYTKKVMSFISIHFVSQTTQWV
jgi:hypothetical protein